LISAQNLSKQFEGRDGSPVLALSDVSFQIAAGKFVCIVGPSGCGKSTLLRLIAGLEGRHDGVLLLDGQAITKPSPAVGVMFQSATLLPWFSILKNVMLPMQLDGRKEQAAARAQALLTMTRLNGFEKKYPYQLSGGMQQRAAICRALARDPAVLLMDEPFGALDALTRDRMNLELQRIWEESAKTVVMVTHSIQEAILLSDTVIVMSPRPGRILAEIDIDLPRPRSFHATTATAEYNSYARQIRDMLYESGEVDA
jgi:NitT/TauT family transport system ATP-binding protein